MKKFLIAATALSGLLVFAGSASGADLAVAVDPAYDWTGFYAGLQAGYAWGDSTSEAFGNLGPGSVTTASLDPDGWFGGIHAGYNFQTSGSLVFGLEGDINLADIDSGNETTTDGAGVLSPGNTHRGEMDWNGSARVRLGFAVDRLLPYLTGGLAFGGYEVDFDHVLDSGSLDETMVGWTVGGGFALPLFPLENQEADLKTQDIRVGISFKF